MCVYVSVVYIIRRKNKDN